MRTLSFLLILLLSFPAFANDTLKVSSNIDHVTLYYSGAQIERSVKVKLLQGNQLVLIKNLPYQLDEKSLQIQLSQDIKLLSVKREQYEPDFNRMDEEKRILEQRDSLEREIRIINQKIQVQRQIERLILSNQNFKNKEGAVQLADVKAAAEFYDVKLNSCKDLIFSYTLKISQIKEKIDALTVDITKLQSKMKHYYSDIIVQLESPKIQTSEIKLSYLTQFAGWKPTYDFRVEEIGKPLSIIYRADVFQSTGEDWNPESITLSSGNPRQGGNKPELAVWNIFQPQPVPYNSTYNPDNNGRISGKIYDIEDGKSLKGAFVLLYLNNQLLQVCETGEDGLYQINPLQAGYYTMEVQHLGYNQSGRVGIQIYKDQHYKYPVALRKAYSHIINEVSIESEIVSVPVVTNQGAVNYAVDDAAYYSNIEMDYAPSSSATMKMPTAMYEADMLSIDNVELTRAKSIQEINFVSNIVKPTAANLEYTIKEKISIPADGNPNKLKIKEVKVAVDFVYHAVPQLDPDAFLTANITEWEQLNLLNGKAQIFYEGTFIAESYIDVLQTSDTLELSLGRDKNIVIERVENKKLSNKSFIGGMTKDNIIWHLTVRNNRGIPVNLVIEEQIPVSTNKDIEILLTRPSGGVLDKNTGFITWKHTIEANKTIEYEYEYMVKYPETVKINY